MEEIKIKVKEKDNRRVEGEIERWKNKQMDESGIGSVIQINIKDALIDLHIFTPISIKILYISFICKSYHVLIDKCIIISPSFLHYYL